MHHNFFANFLWHLMCADVIYMHAIQLHKTNPVMYDEILSLVCEK